MRPGGIALHSVRQSRAPPCCSLALRGIMVSQQLTIHFDALRDIAHRGVRRAAAFVALGQRAWTDETINSVTVETPFSIQLLPDPLPRELADEVRNSFRLWVIGNALAEIVQGLMLYADEYFRIATLL